MSDAIDLLADQRADGGIDEDVRPIAISWAIRTIEVYCPLCQDGWLPGERARFDTQWCAPEQLPATHVVSRALRILRHYGLLIEHGEGVVSIKENGNA